MLLAGFLRNRVLVTAPAEHRKLVHLQNTDVLSIHFLLSEHGRARHSFPALRTWSRASPVLRTWSRTSAGFTHMTVGVTTGAAVTLLYQSLQRLSELTAFQIIWLSASPADVLLTYSARRSRHRGSSGFSHSLPKTWTLWSPSASLRSPRGDPDHVGSLVFPFLGSSSYSFRGISRALSLGPWVIPFLSDLSGPHKVVGSPTSPGLSPLSAGRSRSRGS